VANEDFQYNDAKHDPTEKKKEFVEVFYSIRKILVSSEFYGNFHNHRISAGIRANSKHK